MPNPGQTVEDLTRLFGGGPIAAAFAVLLVSCTVLFFLLQRSNRQHLKTALLVVPIGEKMAATLQDTARVMEEATRAFELATATLVRSQASARRARAAGPGQDGGAQGGGNRGPTTPPRTGGG